MQILDCRNKTCPAPVIETRKLIQTSPGLNVEVLVSDDVARDNVTRMARNQGYAVKTEATEDGFSLKMVPETNESVAPELQPSMAGETIVFVTSETIGQGDDELGTVLMKNFIMTLHELDNLPDKILFLNGGVNLTCKGSDLIETLQQLADNGVDIISCGLCLEFFGLREKIVAGRIGNMLETVEALASAGRIIKP